MDKVEIVRTEDINKALTDTAKTGKSFTLEELEAKMMELADVENASPTTILINEKRIGMYEKIANLRMRRLQLQELLKEQQVTEIEAKPITVQFISANTNDQVKRIEQIDADILSKTTNKQDA